jgi:hypothetical protein
MYITAKCEFLPLVSIKMLALKKKSTNIRSTTIIQVQNMNLKLKMKDIDKILAKAHFKCNLLQFMIMIN